MDEGGAGPGQRCEGEIGMAASLGIFAEGSLSLSKRTSLPLLSFLLYATLVESGKKQLIPQQLGIGVSGGIQITTIGLAMKYEEAKDSRDFVFCAIDIANAHNAFPQRLCLRDSH